MSDRILHRFRKNSSEEVPQTSPGGVQTPGVSGCARMSTIDARRLQKAVWLSVQPVALGRFLVSGGTDDHMVHISAGWVRCDCLDAQLHGDGCKHGLAVRLHSGDSEVVRALRQLVPNPKHYPSKRRQVPA